MNISYMKFILICYIINIVRETLLVAIIVPNKYNIGCY